MKTLIFATGDGEYDDYHETIQLVIQVSDHVSVDMLWKEYLEWANLEENRVVLPRRKKKSVPRMDFHEFLRCIHHAENFEYDCR